MFARGVPRAEEEPMMATTRPALVPAILLLMLTLPGVARSQTATPPDASTAPDSTQAQPASPDSLAGTPPAGTTPAPTGSVAPAAGAATTTPPPAQAAPSTTPPPAQAAPPATAPAAEAAQTPPPAQASAPQARKEPFTKGTTRVSLTGGWGRSFDEDYLMLGIGAGRFIANGLNIGLDLEAWMFGDPGILKISPNVNYVLSSPRRRTKPYVGGFWRRTMVEDAEDLSSIGGRAGAYFKGAGPVMIGGGVVYEDYLDCDENLYQSCSQVYPEFLISASF